MGQKSLQRCRHLAHSQKPGSDKWLRGRGREQWLMMGDPSESSRLTFREPDIVNLTFKNVT